MTGRLFKFDGKGRGEGVRAGNRAAVMQLVLEEPGIDRTRLARATGLTNAAMTRIVQELVAAGIVKDIGQLDSEGSRGRRRSGLQIDESGGFVLGLCILAFNSSVALADISGQIIEVVPVKPSDIGNPGKTLDEISAVAHALLQRHHIPDAQVLGAGVAITGYLSDSGYISDSSPTLGWPDFDLHGSLVQRLNMPVAIDNVNRCIAIAENRIGSCKGVKDFVLLRAAIGIGGALISNGELINGNNNRAGHIGHSCVQPDGLPCACGASGCLNTVASGWAILNQLGLLEVAGLTPDLKSQEAKLRQVLSSKFESDDHYQSIIRLAGAMLADHSRGLLHTLNPQSVVLTGPLGRNATYCEGFQNTLVENKLPIKILTAHEHEVTGPAPAASVLALATHVYSSSLNIQILQDLHQHNGTDLIEGQLL